MNELYEAMIDGEIGRVISAQDDPGVYNFHGLDLVWEDCVSSEEFNAEHLDVQRLRDLDGEYKDITDFYIGDMMDLDTEFVMEEDADILLFRTTGYRGTLCYAGFVHQNGKNYFLDLVSDGQATELRAP